MIAVRAYNEFGIAVPHGEISVDVWIDGNYTGLEMSFDAFGYATANVANNTPIAAAFKISDSESDFNTAYMLHPTPPLTIPIASPLPYSDRQPDHVIKSTEGHVLAYGGELWWRHVNAASVAHRVANLGKPIRGSGKSMLTRMVYWMHWYGLKIIFLHYRKAENWAIVRQYRNRRRPNRWCFIFRSDGDTIPDFAIGLTESTSSKVMVFQGRGMGI